MRCETVCSVPRPTSLAAQARSAKSRWLFVHVDPPVTTELFPLRLSDECMVPLHLLSSESAPRHVLSTRGELAVREVRPPARRTNTVRLRIKMVGALAVEPAQYEIRADPIAIHASITSRWHTIAIRSIYCDCAIAWQSH